LPLIAWLGGLIVGTALFHALGSGPLAAPPLDPAGWSAWLAERDALIAAVAVLRLVVLALSWYLVGATTIGIAARLARAARLVRVADTLTVPFVRRLLQATLGLSLATSMVVSAMPSGSLQVPVEESSVSLSAMPPGSSDALPSRVAASEAELRAVTADQEEGVTLERLPPSGRPLPLELVERARERARAADGAVSAEAEGEAESVPDLARDADGSIDRGVDEYVVTPGDSLWSIAEATLVADEREPDDEAVATYWRAVVEANRDALTDPENPDLIFPGQVVRLPELPA
jgi:hypothetical protein